MYKDRTCWCQLIHIANPTKWDKALIIVVVVVIVNINLDPWKYQ